MYGVFWFVEKGVRNGLVCGVIGIIVAKAGWGEEGRLIDRGRKCSQQSYVGLSNISNLDYNFHNLLQPSFEII